MNSFVEILRDIRDVKYVDIVAKHTTVLSSAAAVALQHAEVINAYNILSPHLVAIDAVPVKAVEAATSASSSASSATQAQSYANQAIAALTTLTNEVTLAQAARTEAVSAKDLANSYKDMASLWADKTDGEVVAGRYSAKFWADVSQTYSQGVVYTSIGVYSFPDLVFTINGFAYRCIGTNVSGVEPSSDPTKWTRVQGGITNAAALPFTANGDLISTNVQDVIVELRDDTDQKLVGKSDVSHLHDDRYYTETETDTLLSGKSDTTHLHDDRYYTETETDTLLSGKSDTTHLHDDRYYTETETDTFLAQKQDVLTNLISTTTIGTPGALGFGVGIAPAALVNSMGLYPMPGYNDVTSENYGNYIDALGSVMVFVPKFYHKITNDVAAPYYGTKVEVSDTAATGFVINRAFVNNGVIQDGFFIDKYLCGNVGSKFVGMRGIDPVSTAADHNPIASITGVTLGNRYDAIFQAVKSRGAGYAVPSMFMYNAIALLSLAHAQAATPATAAWMDVSPYAPKGCNNNALGDSNDISIKYVAAGNTTYPTAPLNASCSDTAFAKITHNGQKCGITDINGNMWEIASGFIQSSADAFWTLKTTIDIKNLTGAVVTDATDNWNTANYDSLTLPFTPNETQTTFGNGTSAVFSGNTDTASNAYRLDAAGVPLSMGGAPVRFGGDGLWQYSTASMCPIVGGHWSSASAAGVWARAWNAARSNTTTYVGGRACLIGA